MVLADASTICGPSQQAQHACSARHEHRVPAPPRRPPRPPRLCTPAHPQALGPRERGASGRGLAPLRQLVADVLEQDVDRGRVLRAAWDLHAAARRITRRTRAVRAGCSAPHTSEP